MGRPTWTDPAALAGGDALAAAEEAAARAEDATEARAPLAEEAAEATAPLAEELGNVSGNRHGKDARLTQQKRGRTKPSWRHRKRRMRG
jgi:hypothetical protein